MSNQIVLIVYWAGTHREEWERRQRGESEYFYGIHDELGMIEQLSEQVKEVVLLNCHSEKPFDQQLTPKLRAVGPGPLLNRSSRRKVLDLMERQQPTDVVLTSPSLWLLHGVMRSPSRAMASLADSLVATTFREQFRQWRIIRALNSPGLDWVCNHGTASCRLLEQQGVPAHKLVPWDRPYSWSDQPPKELKEGTEPFTVAYVGSLCEAKGVGDLLQALAILRRDGFPVKLKLAGGMDEQWFNHVVAQTDTKEHIEYVGRIPNDQVVAPFMRNADLVVVPSRHNYSEGFPKTVLEAFCSRTPLITSDHPVFAQELHHGSNSLQFEAGNPTQLAQAIARLLSERLLYKSLSENSEGAWRYVTRVDTDRFEVIQRWITNTPEDRAWIESRSLASPLYQK